MWDAAEAIGTPLDWTEFWYIVLVICCFHSLTFSRTAAIGYIYYLNYTVVYICQNDLLSFCNHIWKVGFTKNLLVCELRVKSCTNTSKFIIIDVLNILGN